MQWCLEQATKQIEITLNDVEKKVNDELNNEISDIWETYHRVQNESTGSIKNSSMNNDSSHSTVVAAAVSNENVTPSIVNRMYDDEHQQNNIASSTKKFSDMKISTNTVINNNETGSGNGVIQQQQQQQAIRVDIVSGPYIGKFFILKPTSRSACLIGRSTSKKFKDKGISLSKDGEISTSHGKIEKIDNDYYYIDTGSTNGSKLKESGYEIPSHEPILLPKISITELIIGASTLQIQIL